MESDKIEPIASTSTIPLTSTSPSSGSGSGTLKRTKSKWDSLEELEEFELIKEKKKLKKNELLKFKLNKERDFLLGGRTFDPSPGLSGSSTPTNGGLNIKGEASRSSSIGITTSSNNSPRLNGSNGRVGSTGTGGVRRIRDSHPLLESCRSVYSYERLNHIEEGSYGIVFRAKDKLTGSIVAIKKLKMDKEKNGFPITSLREIQTLMNSNHENIVRVREICVGDTLTQIFIVMDFIEHDLKTLLSTMPSPFLSSEIKTLLLQLLSAIAQCHDNWIIHRDLKTSNLLMNNRGEIKVADFGLARMFGDPMIGGEMTELVVTLWYRAPELLLGSKTYSTAIDMWSIGCIFGELILKQPLLPGKGEIDQLMKIFSLLGKPTEESWSGFSNLPNSKSVNLSGIPPYSTLRPTFPHTSPLGLDLLSRLLTYDPAKRITAEEALLHDWFKELPLPKNKELFGSFPSVAGGEKKHIFVSPSAPVREDVQYDFV